MRITLRRHFDKQGRRLGVHPVGKLAFDPPHDGDQPLLLAGLLCRGDGVGGDRELRDVKIRGCLSMGPRAVLEADPQRQHFHWFSWHHSGHDRKQGDAGLHPSLGLCGSAELTRVSGNHTYVPVPSGLSTRTAQFRSK